MAEVTLRSVRKVYPNGFVAIADASFGDFDGDGMCDVFWRNTSTGETSLWLMNGASYSLAVRLMTVTPSWNVVKTP